MEQDSNTQYPTQQFVADLHSEQLLTLTEACRLLRIGRFTLYKMRRDGMIKAVYPKGKPNGQGGGNKFVRIPLTEVQRVIKEGLVDHLAKPD